MRWVRDVPRQTDRGGVRDDGSGGCTDVEQVGVRVERERRREWDGVVRHRRQRGDELQGGVCRHGAWYAEADPARMAGWWIYRRDTDCPKLLYLGARQESQYYTRSGVARQNGSLAE